MNTELLAPAGNLDKLKWAAAYGADAVYFGVEDFSLRSFAGNFTLEDADSGIKHLHKFNRKGYITLNIYPFSNEISRLIETAKKLDDMGADAFIISDLGALFELKKLGLRTPFHISTQANTLNYQTILAYKELGAKRVNLARELSLDHIKEIQTALDGSGMETEVFIHGAVCFSYSGRCAISDYLTGRRANRGECTQPCRWQYALVEEKRPGVYFPVVEDEKGLYFFNSKDLALYKYIPEFVKCGVNSLKIEGRMKNSHYIASIVSIYRRILDGENIPEDQIKLLMGKVSNRGYSEGFMKGSIDEDDYQIDYGGFQSTSTYMASSTDKTQDGFRVCKVKNTIKAGETFEILTPDGKTSLFTMPNPLIRLDGVKLESANNQDLILLDESIKDYTIFRKVIENVPDKVD